MNNKLYIYKLKQQLVLLFFNNTSVYPSKRVNQVGYFNKIAYIINNVINNEWVVKFDTSNSPFFSKTRMSIYDKDGFIQLRSMIDSRSVHTFDDIFSKLIKEK